MNIYVGNLSAETTDDELRGHFAAFGEVKLVNIVTDTYFGKFRGHGFVEMPSHSEGGAAIEALNGTILKDRRINVLEALPLSRKAARSLR